jgi:hypothetical protein
MLNLNGDLFLKKLIHTLLSPTLLHFIKKYDGGDVA